MKKDIQHICCTSIDDARGSLRFKDRKDLKMLKKAVLYELAHGNRKTMIKMIKAKIRQLEKSKGADGR